MTIDEIKNLRSQLPNNWEWRKSYELSYNEAPYRRKHWALADPTDKMCVLSLGTISIDNYSSGPEFKKEIPIRFIEQSLAIVDFLLAEVERLQPCKHEPDVLTDDKGWAVSCTCKKCGENLPI